METHTDEQLLPLPEGFGQILPVSNEDIDFAAQRFQEYRVMAGLRACILRFDDHKIPINSKQIDFPDELIVLVNTHKETPFLVELRLIGYKKDGSESSRLEILQIAPLSKISIGTTWDSKGGWHFSFNFISERGIYG